MWFNKSALRTREGNLSTNVTKYSPLIAAGSRFPVGTAEDHARDGLSARHRRSFLLRFAEPIKPCQYPTSGATPKTTTGYDGKPDEESEDFNEPDFHP
jgi:hypothetical protein